jgi:hypothetical protein
MSEQFGKFTPKEELKKVKPTPVEKKKPIELTKEENEYFIDLLKKAKEAEKKGNLEEAIKLYLQYKEEYEALRKKKEGKKEEKEIVEEEMFKFTQEFPGIFTNYFSFKKEEEEIGSAVLRKIKIKSEEGEEREEVRLYIVGFRRWEALKNDKDRKELLFFNEREISWDADGTICPCQTEKFIRYSESLNKERKYVEREMVGHVDITKKGKKIFIKANECAGDKYITPSLESSYPEKIKSFLEKMLPKDFEVEIIE